MFKIKIIVLFCLIFCLFIKNRFCRVGGKVDFEIFFFFDMFFFIRLIILLSLLFLVFIINVIVFLFKNLFVE